MSHSLQNYIRANRKRLGLSQEEVAFLLGTRSGAKICRYESFVRVPSLETALAFEAIFQKPVRQIFKGLYEDVGRDIAARAKALTYRTKYQSKDRITQKKRDSLLSITGITPVNSIQV